MTKTKSNKIYAFIAAAFFGGYLACRGIRTILYICRNSFTTYIGNNIFDWIFSGLLFLILLAAMSISLFTRNKKLVIGVTFAYAIYCICDTIYYNIFYNILYFSEYYNSISDYFSIWTFIQMFFEILTYVTLIICAFFAIKKNKIFPKIWFLPGAIMLFGRLLFWAHYGYFSMISYMIIDIIEITALLFMGIWFKKDMAPAKDEVVNEYETFNPETLCTASATAESAIGGADKIKKYKELLDSGVITQEEFEAKKKQILGI